MPPPHVLEHDVHSPFHLLQVQRPLEDDEDEDEDEQASVLTKVAARSQSTVAIFPIILQIKSIAGNNFTRNELVWKKSKKAVLEWAFAKTKTNNRQKQTQRTSEKALLFKQPASRTDNFQRQIRSFYLRLFCTCGKWQVIANNSAHVKFRIVSTSRKSTWGRQSYSIFVVLNLNTVVSHRVLKWLSGGCHKRIQALAGIDQKGCGNNSFIPFKLCLFNLSNGRESRVNDPYE